MKCASLLISSAKVFLAMNSEPIEKTANPFVFFDIKFGSAKAGRVVIELFKNEVPKTVENFRALCTGEKGIGKQGAPLHYKNTIFHRVVPLFLVQGGDITKGTGVGGESIYGDKFEDENFNISHDREGVVGMANNGVNTNNSQFYITTVPCPHLDGINVVFGIVRKGLNIIVEMAEIPRDGDSPLEPITIDNCGEFQPGESWCIEENDGTEDVYPPWPNDWDIEVKGNDKLIADAINKIKASGNYFFDKKNYVDSERKYKKALRYIDWYIGTNKEENRAKVEDLKVNSLLNLAAVRLRRHQHRAVIDICNQVISRDSHNGKAYYRRAQARLASKDYDKALTDLHKAISLHPNDRNIQAVLNMAKKNKLSYLKREKRFYGNVFK